VTHTVDKTVVARGRRSPRQTLSRLRGTDRRWVADYGLWKLHRLEDRIPRRSRERLQRHVRPLEDALLAASPSGTSPHAVTSARQEFAELWPRLSEHADLRGVADPSLAETEYVLTRLRAPRVVVETGVWRGMSSWTILAALERSGSGTLVSVDFPPLDAVQRVEVGHLVPGELRSRWRLELGPSRQVLPPLLREYAPVGIFVHDSDHTYFNMMREFAQGWRALAPGGVLVSDDVEANDAFLRFARRCGRQPYVVQKQNPQSFLGVLVK